jgi:hypothetical protein
MSSRDISLSRRGVSSTTTGGRSGNPKESAEELKKKASILLKPLKDIEQEEAANRNKEEAAKKSQEEAAKNRMPPWHEGSGEAIARLFRPPSTKGQRDSQNPSPRGLQGQR